MNEPLRAEKRLPDVKRRAMVGTIVTCFSAIVIALAITHFPAETDYSRIVREGGFPDLIHERVLATEALRGDPYRPLDEILSEYGYSGLSGGVAPRTPGAFLMQLPLLGIPDSVLMPVATLLILLLVFVTLVLTSRISAVEWWRVSLIGPLVYVSLPVVTAIAYGSLSVMVIVVMVLLAWAYPDKKGSGALLGIAAASRLWPALLVVGFLISGKRRSTAEAVISFAIVTLCGLMLRGVTIEGTVDSLIQGTSAWLFHNQNASAAAVLARVGVPIIVTVVGISLLGLWLAMRRRSRAIDLTAVAALLASPLSWPTYSLVAFPTGAIEWRRRGSLVVLLLAAPSLAWIWIPRAYFGALICASLVALLVLTARGDASRPLEPQGEAE